MILLNNSNLNISYVKIVKLKVFFMIIVQIFFYIDFHAFFLPKFSNSKFLSDPIYIKTDSF